MKLPRIAAPDLLGWRPRRATTITMLRYVVLIGSALATAGTIGAPAWFTWLCGTLSFIAAGILPTLTNEAMSEALREPPKPLVVEPPGVRREDV